jgi:hypothetical protein
MCLTVSETSAAWRPLLRAIEVCLRDCALVVFRSDAEVIKPRTASAMSRLALVIACLALRS